VLGIDPGLVETGFGLLAPGARGLDVLDTGVIVTDKHLVLEARLQIVYDGVHGLIEKHAPDVVVLEELYTEYKFPRTALMMAHARGVICLAARQRNVSVRGIAPGEVKRAVTGNGAASKDQVQRCVQQLLRLPGLPKPSHIADALALAFTGLSRSGARIQ
jgi:crossover junction endodeoxyribonuclease RuvC